MSDMDDARARTDRIVEFWQRFEERLAQLPATKSSPDDQSVLVVVAMTYLRNGDGPPLWLDPVEFADRLYRLRHIDRAPFIVADTDRMSAALTDQDRRIVASGATADEVLESFLPGWSVRGRDEGVGD